MIPKDQELYEYIFCSLNGAKNREQLLIQYKDRLPALKREHQKHGMKLNGNIVVRI